MHNYAALSDHDFELLSASLLEAEFGGTWNTFARGGDGGVDVRRTTPTTLDIAQCKHMMGSPIPKLLFEARKEKERLDKLAKKPTSYRFLTTKALSPGNKDDLMADLSPYVVSTDDIWGQQDLEARLTKHPHVERQHVKLWIAGAGQLSAQVNSGVWERSRQLAVDIENALPRYVETGVLGAAIEQIEANRVLIVSGPPGVGKTTVARLLVAQAVADGYEPVEISSDVDEGQRVIDPDSKQIFIYDDFLGNTFLSNRLDKNEDKRLASFIRSVELSSSKMFVMTTREYILRQALVDLEDFERVGVHFKRLVIHLKDYTRVERGRILYNHLYHSPLVGEDQLAQLKADRKYQKIIDHRNYNPRLIEFMTMTDPRLRDEPPADFVEYALSVLDSPESVWRRPFERQLNAIGQSLVLLLACTPGQISSSDVDDLLQAALAAGMFDELNPGDLERALEVLDDSFVATDRGGPTGTTLLIRLHNPSIADFVANLLADERTRRNSVVAAALYFQQASWLFNNLRRRVPEDERDEFFRLISEALLRTFKSSAPKLTNPPFNPWLPTSPKWVHADPAENLIELHSVMSLSKPCADLLSEPFESLLAEQVQLWTDDPASFPEETCVDIVALMTRLAAKDTLDDHHWQVVLNLVGGLPATSMKWALLNSLAGLKRQPEVLEAWRDEFEQWLDHLLDLSVDEVETQDLDEAVMFAEEIGTAIDEERYDHLREEIQMRQSELDDRAYDEWKDHRGYRDGDSELGAIFER